MYVYKKILEIKNPPSNRVALGKPLNEGNRVFL